MEYEINYDNKPINLHLIIIIGIAAIVFYIMFFPMFFSQVKTDIPVEVTPNVSVITITEYVTVLVTPTQDGIHYFASEYQNGLRKIKKPFSFNQQDVTGYKDLVVHAQVYDYRIFDYYTWFNPTDYKYYRERPSAPDKKFAFVFMNIWMDDNTGDDTRLWLPNASHFGLQARDTIYYPIPFMKQLRIKELEETYNLNDDSRIKYYGVNTYYSSNKQYAETAGETYEELTYLRGGKSNAIDGYIVFEIPEDIKEEELVFRGEFYKFGSASWKLKPDISDVIM